MTYFNTSVMILFLFLSSCCSSTKNTSKTNENDKIKKEVTKMTENGYTNGIIVASKKDGDCPFTIKLEGESSNVIDPINLDDSYKKDGKKVTIKYQLLRRKNRCENANPVNIIEIKER